jgi:hypothetical protein
MANSIWWSRLEVIAYLALNLETILLRIHCLIETEKSCLAVVILINLMLVMVANKLFT